MARKGTVLFVLLPALYPLEQIQVSTFRWVAPGRPALLGAMLVVAGGYVLAMLLTVGLIRTP